MKTHGTCEKRERGKRDKKGARIGVEGHPWENGNDRAGLSVAMGLPYPQRVGAGEARVRGWRGGCWKRYSGDIPSLKLPESIGWG